jgi:signal transduction histidine kinase/ketosteroid isomerase-like protein
MKNTKKLEKEIRAVMDDYWVSYLKGDLQTWASYLPDDYRNIGTTKAEIWNNKKEIVEYTQRVIDQMVGMAETRNKKTHIIPYDPYFMVHELGDLYVKVEEGWIFYAPFRLSSLLEKTADGWKILHQHGSYPDSKADEGEAFAFSELKVENKKLRDAIKSRTLELEQKNRELEIEAALERIRAASMAMHNSEELSEVGQVFLSQIEHLAIPLFGIGIVVVNEDTRNAVQYMVDNTNTDQKPLLHKFEYQIDDFPIAVEGLKLIKKGKTEFTIASGKKGIAQWIAWVRKHMSPERAERLEQAHLEKVYFHTLQFHGLSNINFTSLENLSPENWSVMRRLVSTFAMAYRRFLDLQKAEEQAREAEIEAALERVRAATMAMHKTEELAKVVEVISQQFQELGIDIFMVYVGIYTYSLEDKYVDQWFSPIKGIKNDPFYIRLPSAPWEDTTIKEWRAGKEMGYLSIQGAQAIMEYAKAVDAIANWNIFERMAKEYSVEVLEQTEANHQYGNLSIIQDRKATKKEEAILKRFAKVFEQTYTRFLDLQRAEGQAREAEIEASLERLRSATMAMHQSSELHMAAGVLFEQLSLLGADLFSCGFVLCEEDNPIDEQWMYAPNAGKIVTQYIPHEEERVHFNLYKAWKSKTPLYSETVEGQELEELLKFMMAQPSVQKNLMHFISEGIEIPKLQILHGASFSKGYLFIITTSRFPEEQIFTRFAKVFEQTYTRFLDLQRAEAQAREAQIEAALENVRSRTMAMHQSHELREVVAVMYEKMELLGLAKWGVSIMISHEETEEFEFWLAEETNSSHTGNYFAKATEHPVYRKIWEHWKAQGPPITLHHQDAYKREFDEYWLTKTDFKYLPDEVKASVYHHNEVFLNYASMRHGLINAISFESLSDDLLEILARFAKVFEQTYTRFLDLQRAEAQVREAKIEAALERVRARTMAMHNSIELSEVSTLLFKELNVFCGQVLASGVVLCDREPPEQWMCSPDMFMLPPIHIPKDLDEVIYNLYQAWESGLELYSEFIQGQELKLHNEALMELPEIQAIFEHSPAKMYVPKSQTNYAATFKQGYLLIITEIPFDDDALFPRFAKVFEQTYTRFLDLQRAEAQAKEAMKQAALDRVRGEIASMRSTEDLNRITPVIWRELTSLGVPFLRCGVFIVNENAELIEVYLTTPEGEALGVLNLPFNLNTQAINLVKYWKKKEVYREHWDAQTFTEWTQSMIEMGQVKNFADYQGAGQIPDELHLHFVPFKQGMLYVGDANPLEDDKIELVKTLAEAFAIAYARYEDFVRLEEAKSAVEATLKELKATQAQLIQSEKMASLGELTAGIAHEIQNPLNFVNNFSELNSELLEELEEELTKGDLEEVKTIAKDLKSNEEKINHHGKRAEAIVKGMLQHSRKSTGEKMLTDLNQLADEYLRLAYHGLRAKDKTFNAVLNTDFEPTLEKVMVIPQDIGRVVLNLVTNAFYAVQEKQKNAENDYQPRVSISTKKSKDHIIVTLKDNGNGIPQQVLDKIFQPFFTTKPTGQGTGLGLSLSYDIIKAHGGQLEVETEEGAYTIFKIILPNNK